VSFFKTVRSEEVEAKTNADLDGVRRGIAAFIETGQIQSACAGLQL
jgi:hypothetical protein